MRSPRSAQRAATLRGEAARAKAARGTRRARRARRSRRGARGGGGRRRCPRGAAHDAQLAALTAAHDATAAGSTEHIALQLALADDQRPAESGASERVLALRTELSAAQRE